MKRAFVGLGRKLEMGWGKRKKQIPRCARNDNLGEFRRVAGMWLWLRDSALRRVEARGAMAGRRRVVEPARFEDWPLRAGRIRRSWGVKECAAMGPVVGLEEVASGEWRVTSDNSRAVGRAGVGVEVGVIRAVWVWGRAGSGSRGCG